MLHDNDIIARVQSGERELFGELHTRHHERVFRYVARSIFEPEAAQDVACEVWLRAYNAVDRFQPQGGHSVLSWLLRIASNLVIDYRRRLPPTQQPDEHDEWENSLHLVAPAAEREALRAAQDHAVRKALATLTVGDQQIIHLAHQDDLSSAQIAAILEKPSVSAATSHLHRAMQHLKKALERSDWFGDEANSDREKRQAARRA